MKNILYSRRLTEKINPAYFRQCISIGVRSVVTNSIGEKDYAYSYGATLRALVAHRDQTEDDFNMDKTTMHNQHYITVITYMSDPQLINPDNRIKWHDYTPGVDKVMRIDGAYEAYGFYVRIKCVFEE